MANFVFYILWYMTMLQSFDITWRIHDNANMGFEMSEFLPNKIDSLVTSKNINYIDTFNFVFEEAKKLYYKLEGRGR